MRHLFDQRYSVREGIHPDGSPRMVERMRCSRCGMGANSDVWPGADGSCPGPLSTIEATETNRKSREARSRSRGKPTRGPDGRVYRSLALMCVAYGLSPDVVRGALRRTPGLTPGGAVRELMRKEAAE
jgi:hypothetical protein